MNTSKDMIFTSLCYFLFLKQISAENRKRKCHAAAADWLVPVRADRARWTVRSNLDLTLQIGRRSGISDLFSPVGSILRVQIGRGRSGGAARRRFRARGGAIVGNGEISRSTARGGVKLVPLDAGDDGGLDGATEVVGVALPFPCEFVGGARRVAASGFDGSIVLMHKNTPELVR